MVEILLCGRTDYNLSDPEDIKRFSISKRIGIGPKNLIKIFFLPEDIFIRPNGNLPTIEEQIKLTYIEKRI